MLIRTRHQIARRTLFFQVLRTSSLSRGRSWWNRWRKRREVLHVLSSMTRINLHVLSLKKMNMRNWRNSRSHYKSTRRGETILSLWASTSQSRMRTSLKPTTRLLTSSTATTCLKSTWWENLFNQNRFRKRKVRSKSVKSQFQFKEKLNKPQLLSDPSTNRSRWNVTQTTSFNQSWSGRKQAALRNNSAISKRRTDLQVKEPEAARPNPRGSMNVSNCLREQETAAVKSEDQGNNHQFWRGGKSNSNRSKRSEEKLMRGWASWNSCRLT